MTKQERERIIKHNMSYLKISREEAEKIVEDDERIDKGERCEWEPSVEEEKEMRKNTKLKVPRKRSTGTKKSKPKDEDKVAMVGALAQALADKDNVKIINEECELTFEFDNREFTVKLIEHRKKD